MLPGTFSAPQLHWANIWSLIYWQSSGKSLLYPFSRLKLDIDWKRAGRRIKILWKTVRAHPRLLESDAGLRSVCHVAVQKVVTRVLPHRSGKKLAITSAGTAGEHLMNSTPVHLVLKGWAPERQLVRMPCKTPPRTKEVKLERTLGQQGKAGNTARSNRESKTLWENAKSCRYVQEKWKSPKNKMETLWGPDD